MNKHEELSLIEQLLDVIGNKNDSLNGQIPDSLRQVKDFIDGLPGGFLIYRADGNEDILYANRALIKLFKCNSLDEFKALTGNSFKGIVYSEDLEEVEKSIEKQIASSHDDLDYVEYRIMDKDGEIRWVEDYGHFVQTRHTGNIFYVFITDATEKLRRRNSERAALINANYENEKKLQNLIEEYDKERKLIRQEHLKRLEVIEGLCVNYDTILYADLDADTVLPYRIGSRTKKQFEDKLKPREYLWFVKDYVNTWVHPDDRKNISSSLEPDYIKRKLAENRTFYLNYRCIQNDELQYIQLRIADVDDSERKSQIVMGYRSIDTEVLQEMENKKILEEALRNAQLASVAKNTFLSNMSHDMRTPLNAVMGFTALAHKRAANDAAVKEYLNKIEFSCKQALEIIDRVLELSYTETQDFHITETECNLCDVIAEVTASYSEQTKNKNLTVKTDLSGVEHGWVFADRNKIKQVLSHIVGNAVKYTDQGGIDITVTEHTATSKDFATYKFSVKDTGKGISKKSLQRIFEPFEREKNTTNSGIFGAGLGLTISKHIIEMMGGSLEADSVAGKGSTFTVTLGLRLKTVGENDGENTESIISSLAGNKILLVEDNEINLEIETEMLQDLGLTVDSAENGLVAVEKIKASAPGEYLFVLMDIQMPVMDGRQATENIRRLDNPALANVPVIALSANALEGDKRASMERGIDEHLSKPIDIPVLLKAVARVLKSKGINIKN